MKLRAFTVMASLAVALALLPVASRVHAQEVENAGFTSAITDGQPADYRQEFPNTVSVVYFYAELLGMAGQSATHRWKHEGSVQAEVGFSVHGERQPTWSSHKMPPDMTGVWSVEVIDAGGKVLSENTFGYSPSL